MGERGRKPTPNSYICNLNDIMFAIACRQQPSQGTEIEVVIPVKHSVTFEQMGNMIFLLDKNVYRVAPQNIYLEPEPLKHSEMRRNFYVWDSFRGHGDESGWQSDTIKVEAPDLEEPVFLSFYWRSMEEKNSAYRR